MVAVSRVKRSTFGRLPDGGDVEPQWLGKRTLRLLIAALRARDQIAELGWQY